MKEGERDRLPHLLVHFYVPTIAGAGQAIARSGDSILTALCRGLSFAASGAHGEEAEVGLDPGPPFGAGLKCCLTAPAPQDSIVENSDRSGYSNHSLSLIKSERLAFLEILRGYILFCHYSVCFVYMWDILFTNLPLMSSST